MTTRVSCNKVICLSNVLWTYDDIAWSNHETTANTGDIQYYFLLEFSRMKSSNFILEVLLLKLSKTNEITLRERVRYFMVNRSKFTEKNVMIKIGLGVCNGFGTSNSVDSDFGSIEDLQEKFLTKFSNNGVYIVFVFCLCRHYMACVQY